MYSKVLEDESRINVVLCCNLGGPSLVEGVHFQTSEGCGHAQILLAHVSRQHPCILQLWSGASGGQQHQVKASEALFVVLVEAPLTLRRKLS